MTTFKARFSTNDTITPYEDIEADNSETALGLFLIERGVSFQTVDFVIYQNPNLRHSHLCFDTDKGRYSVIQVSA